MRRSDTGTGGADIKGLGKFDELGAGGIRTANKDRNLQADAGRTSSGRCLQVFLLLFEKILHEVF